MANIWFFSRFSCSLEVCSKFSALSYSKDIPIFPRNMYFFELLCSLFSKISCSSSREGRKSNSLSTTPHCYEGKTHFASWTWSVGAKEHLKWRFREARKSKRFWKGFYTRKMMKISFHLANLVFFMLIKDTLVVKPTNSTFIDNRPTDSSSWSSMLSWYV